MNKQLETMLTSVAEKTLAELAFVFSMPDDEAVRHVSSALVAAAVDFNGPFSGALTLAVSANMLPAIASNMLGLEEEGRQPSPEEQRDALKELTNVVCGNLLPRLVGTVPVFTIEAPEIVEARQLEGTESGKPAGRTRLVLDEGRAELALFLRGEVPALVADGGPRK